MARTNEELKAYVGFMLECPREDVLGFALVVVKTDSNVAILSNGNKYQVSDLLESARDTIFNITEEEYLSGKQGPEGPESFQSELEQHVPETQPEL